MNIATTTLTLVAALTLAACSSAPRKPDYECPLDDVNAAKCASVQDAYKKSQSMKTPEGATRVQSVFDPRVQQGAQRGQAAQPVFAGTPSNMPEPGVNGMPVFQQPQVMRAWVAPYVDADGNLRSGEYTYFNTPGKWNYGDMAKPGNAAGIFEPARPDNLGFNPVVTPDAKRTPARPAEPGAARSSQPAQGSNAGRVQGAPADSTTAITQPYQRLSNQ